ncbi:MAG: hemerythrin domain-containing protein [Candidatus Omnitrophica bacterium]|nr:hemerythrin domain-containing protein [Candidatus Omnitrophota bacterium]MDE2009284.1 hemerythrin domain-containing protein [Candidatus Omnitrophota bacterium]MDE2213803.1 hemerythrin domain-containing protein [Candidatus Omnitrophota bacterium]
MPLDNILGFMRHDHDELDKYFKKFQSLKRQDFATAKWFFLTFKFSLLRHILWADKILFPVFENKTGMKNRGPTIVMRHNHALIKGALERLHQKVCRDEPDSNSEEEVLMDLLAMHSQKEEYALYPVIDQLMTQEERKSMFQQIQMRS